jgi:hypothetical protein
MSPQGQTVGRRRRSAIIGTCCAAIVIATAVTMAIYETGGEEDRIPPSNPSVPVEAEAKIIAARDIGALPSLTDFCSGAAHCWDFQGAGDASDLVGSWHLTKLGTPRTQVTTHLPVRDSTGWVNFESEKAAMFDGIVGNIYKKTNVTWDSTRVSVTYVYKARPNSTYVFDFGYTGVNQNGFTHVNSTTIAVYTRTTAPLFYYSTSGFSYNIGEWNCVTYVSSSDDSKLFINGEDRTDFTSGTKYYISDATPIDIAVGALTNTGGVLDGGVSRVRVDSSAIALADHRDLCGNYAEPPIGIYTSTGNSRCYPFGDNAAFCSPPRRIAHVYDGTNLGWGSEYGNTNRILYAADGQLDCTNWTCMGSASVTVDKVDPMGSNGASELTVGAGPTNHIYSNTPTYAASAPLFPRVWVKCSSGSLSFHNHHNQLLGDWTIDCSQVGGVWRLAHDYNQPFITQLYPWQSDGSGLANIGFTATTGTVTAQVWVPTLTESVSTSLAVVQTLGSQVFLGNPTWDATNSGSVWKTGASWGVDALYRPVNQGGTGQIVGFKSGQAGLSVSYANGQIRIGGGSTSFSYNLIFSAAVTGLWHTVSGCHDIGRYYLTSDGASAGSLLWGYAEANTALNIAYIPGINWFFGIISDFSIWDDCRRPLQ